MRVLSLRILPTSVALTLAGAAVFAAGQEPVAAESGAAAEQRDSTALETKDSVIPAAEAISRIKTSSTPVDIDREKPEGPVLHYYDKHGDPLETPVRFLAELDTAVTVRSGPKYPAFNGVSVGANFFDAIMMAVGQQRASFDLWADCSIHNWFFPVVEAGIGYSDAWPDEARSNFKVSPSFYARVGLNYNFLYKSNPDYQVFLGLRAGMSSFGYDIYSIAPGSQYYKEDGPKEMTGLRATSFYGQVLAGLKVKLYKGLAMGWSVRLGFDFHNKYSDPDYPAWFVPGKGTGAISATFSLVYTFGRRDKAGVSTSE